MTLSLTPLSPQPLTLTSVGTPALLTSYVVTSYGAVGNGSTDDTLAIQSAINAAVAAAGVLYFPPGNYVCSSPLTVSGKIRVVGSGAGSADHLVSSQTRLSFTTTASDGLQINASGCTLEDIAILNTSGAETAGSGVHVTLGNYMHLNRVGVRGFYDGLSIDSGIYYTVEACYFLNQVRYGIRVQNTAVADAGDGFVGSGTVLWPRSTGSTAAIRWESGGGLKIEGVKINGNGSGGFATGIDAAIVDGAATSVFLVDGCSIENCSTTGVSVTQQGTTGVFGKVILTGNEFGPAGVIPTAVSVIATTIGDIADVAITGNLIFATTNGVAIDGASRVTISGNEINGTFSDSGITLRNVAGGTVGANTIYGQFTTAAVTVKASATPSTAVAIDHQNVVTTAGVQTLILDSAAGVASHLSRSRILYDEERELPAGVGNVTYVSVYQFALPAAIGAGGILEFSIVGRVTGGGGGAFAVYGKRIVTLGSGAGATPTVALIGTDVTAGTTVDYQCDTATAATVKLQVRLNAAQGGTDFSGQVRVKYDGPLTRLIKQ